MNCKPGDLAIVVKAYRPETVGKIVEVLDFLGRTQFRDGTFLDDCWAVYGNFQGSSYDQWCIKNLCEACLPDAWLRPIRDPGDDARDEMLRPLPQEVTA